MYKAEEYTAEKKEESEFIIDQHYESGENYVWLWHCPHLDCLRLSHFNRVTKKPVRINHNYF